MTDAAKADVEKTAEEKGDAELPRNVMTFDYQVKKSTKLPLPSSSLSISSRFWIAKVALAVYEVGLRWDGDIFVLGSRRIAKVALAVYEVGLRWDGDIYVFRGSGQKVCVIKHIQVLKDSVEAEISSLMDVHIQQETPQIQSPSVLKVPILVISETTTLPPIPEIPTETPASMALSLPHLTPTISIGQQTTTPIPTPPIITEAPTITTVVRESDALTIVQLRIKKEHAEKQKMLKYTIKSTNKAALEEYHLKSALYQTMNKNKSFNINPTNHSLYHALIEALIEDENDMDKGVTDTVKNHKRQHDDDEDDDEDP
ncbi:hypothetical protein Tco_0843260 [Tanacetum coccineum]|uniref:Uncharacterized protein n=1 Tax=Tanacetum coccineum TaxID=301880 RepID=A0ABQ5B2U8_9ASTR